LLDFLGKQGIPLEVFQGARKPVSVEKGIERRALRQRRD
jgi:hypothetical protein